MSPPLCIRRVYTIDKRGKLCYIRSTPTSFLFRDSMKKDTQKEANDPQTEWVGMPEFKQEKQKPHAAIIVRFESEEALQEFARLIGQPLTAKTKSIWHPKLERGENTNKRYVDAQ